MKTLLTSMLHSSWSQNNQQGQPPKSNTKSIVLFVVHENIFVVKVITDFNNV